MRPSGWSCSRRRTRPSGIAPFDVRAGDVYAVVDPGRPGPGACSRPPSGWPACWPWSACATRRGRGRRDGGQAALDGIREQLELIKRPQGRQLTSIGTSSRRASRPGSTGSATASSRGSARPRRSSSRRADPHAFVTARRREARRRVVCRLAIPCYPRGPNMREIRGARDVERGHPVRPRDHPGEALPGDRVRAGVSFNMLHKTDLSRIQMKIFCPVEDEIISAERHGQGLRVRARTSTS